MSGPLKEDRAQEAIIEQASAWFLRHRSGELSPVEKTEFLEWLRASKLNMREYFEQVRLHQALTQTLPELQLDRTALLKSVQAQWSTDDNIIALNPSSPLMGKPAASEEIQVKPRIFLAAAASLLLAAGIAWIFGTWTGTQRISVSHGEQRIVQLPDGSAMHINVSSQVAVKYTEHDRVIELDRGQAFFEVAHDRGRPFRVRAGGAEVIAVGTQFDVYRRSDNDVVVTVLQGKVDVKPDGSATGERLRVTAGEQVQIGHTGTRPATRLADVRAATAWMRREVIFNGESLAQVADEINRYIAVPIYIEDEKLKKMRVRAVFNAYDSDSFLAFLEQYNVAVDVSPTAIHVRQRNPSGH